MGFSEPQIAALSAPLCRDYVKQREQAGRKFSYIEGWHCIAEANRIFGFDAWDREMVEFRCVSERERKIGRPPYEKDGHHVGYIARLRIVVHADGRQIVREGSGYGSGIDVDIGAAHESAIKEAETDAMKRALMTFGNPFGLALYDKEQANVETTSLNKGNMTMVAPQDKPAAGAMPLHVTVPPPRKLSEIRDGIKRALQAADNAALVDGILRAHAADMDLILAASRNAHMNLISLAAARKAELSIGAAIHAAPDEDACRRIFDELLNEWGAVYEPDVEMVRTFNPAAVDDLKGRLFTRIRTLREQVPAK